MRIFYFQSQSAGCDAINLNAGCLPTTTEHLCNEPCKSRKKGSKASEAGNAPTARSREARTNGSVVQLFGADRIIGSN